MSANENEDFDHKVETCVGQKARALVQRYNLDLDDARAAAYLEFIILQLEQSIFSGNSLKRYYECRIDPDVIDCREGAMFCFYEDLEGQSEYYVIYPVGLHARLCSDLDTPTGLPYQHFEPNGDQILSLEAEDHPRFTPMEQLTGIAVRELRYRVQKHNPDLRLFRVDSVAADPLLQNIIIQMAEFAASDSTDLATHRCAEWLRNPKAFDAFVMQMYVMYKWPNEGSKELRLAIFMEADFADDLNQVVRFLFNKISYASIV